MNHVQFLPKVRQYFVALVQLLYEREYFGFLEDAKKYVQDLYDSVEQTLPIRPRKPAPPHFDRYGKDMYYASFRKSKHTHWYVFFRIYKQGSEVIYQARYITNSHVAAQHL